MHVDDSGADAPTVSATDSDVSSGGRQLAASDPPPDPGLVGLGAQAHVRPVGVPAEPSSAAAVVLR